MDKIACPSCGYDNNAQANFCGLCGNRLPTARLTATAETQLDDPKDLQKILEITNAINSTLNLEKVLNLVLDYTVEITEGQRGFLILRGESGDLQFRVARNIDQQELGKKEYDISRRAVQVAMEKGEIVATVSAQKDTLFSSSRSVFDLDLQTIVCIPLRSMQAAVSLSGRPAAPETSGAIYIDSKLPVRYFTPQKLNLLEVLANNAAIAIENARLYLELERQKTTIQESAATLELMVQKRTEELDQKNRQLVETIEELRRVQSRLVQSEKMATVGTLAGGVAHEINNPLGSILSNAQRILRHDCAEKRHAVSAELVQEGARRCRAIVENLLAFSRQSDSTLKSLDVNEVMDGTLELLGHHLGIKNVRIEKEYGKAPPVLANRNELSQVFTNLLVNAKDSISETLNDQKLYGTIRIKTHGEGKNAIVEVSDDGKGILQENIGKLFDPFFTTKEVGRGTGLGLYVTLGIIQRHGGKIDVESTPGQGALFRVTLPTLTESEA